MMPSERDTFIEWAAKEFNAQPAAVKILMDEFESEWPKIWSRFLKWASEEPERAVSVFETAMASNEKSFQRIVFIAKGVKEGWWR